MRKLTRIAVAAAVALATLTACGGDGDQAGTAEETVRWAIPGVTTAPAQAMAGLLPVVLGYWEEEGVNVEIQRLAGAGEVVQSLAAGQTDVGNISTGNLLEARQAGSEIVAFYTQFTKNFLAPAVPEDSDIESIADMRGATIGVASLESGTIPLITSMLGSEGISEDEVTFVAVGRGSDVAEVLNRGRIDVVGLPDSDQAALEALGIPLRVISNDYFDSLGFQQVQVASSEWMEGRKDTIVKLHRAFAKATLFAMENPEAVVRLNWAAFPESRPTDVPEAEALAREIKILEGRLNNLEPVDGVWGLSTEEQIRTAVEVYAGGASAAEEFTISDFWTDEYLNEINDFDADEVVQQARDFDFDTIDELVEGFGG